MTHMTHDFILVYHSNLGPILHHLRDIAGFYSAMHYSVKRGIAMSSVCRSVRLSVCNVGGSGAHRLEILETNCTDSYIARHFFSS